MAPDQHSKELNHALAKPLAYTVGILGLIQGVGWFVCSVLGILCYFGSIQVENTTTNSSYGQLLYALFLDKDANNLSSMFSNDHIIVKPEECTIFMWFYVIFSAIWTCVSGSIIWAMIHNQWQLSKTLFGAWSTTTIFISVVDIVLMGLIVADYVTVSEIAQTEVLVTYGIFMTLAARGYVLWIINVVLAGIMMKFTIDIILNDKNDARIPFIHGYESNDVNPPWFNGSVKDFWASPQTTTNTNDGYENQGFNRSESFFPKDMTNDSIYSSPPSNLYSNYANNSNHNNTSPNKIYYSPPADQYKTPTTTTNNKKNYNNTNPSSNNTMSFSEAIAQKTATIGRNKGRRSPPNHVSPPVIPDPDYTPPNSPHGLKSVLRSKSNYNQP